ncbi:13114_t:CDS:2, partial [Dentiscutata heterogama]
LHGESGSADLEAINLNLSNIIHTTNKYALHDIYNMDEMGLFYTMAPDRTIASCQIEGAKKDCIWLTIALHLMLINNVKSWMTAMFFQ